MFCNTNKNIINEMYFHVFPLYILFINNIDNDDKDNTIQNFSFEQDLMAHTSVLEMVRDSTGSAETGDIIIAP